MIMWLRFPSLLDLWQFKETVQVKTVEILTGEQVLIGDFVEAEIELAQKTYMAELISAKVSRTTGAT